MPVAEAFTFDDEDGLEVKSVAAVDTMVGISTSASVESLCGWQSRCKRTVVCLCAGDGCGWLQLLQGLHDGPIAGGS